MEDYNEYYDSELDDEGGLNIDFAGIFRKLLSHWKTIVWFGFGFGVLGVAVALINPRMYSASRVFVPQRSGTTSSSVRSLASLAGISLGDGLQDGPMSPLVYPHILSNVDFQKELIHDVRLNFHDQDTAVTIFDYYTDIKYSKHPKRAARAAAKLEKEESKETVVSMDAVPVGSLDKKETAVLKFIMSNISLSIDKKEGYLTLVTEMPDERVGVAQLNEAVFELLRKYVSKFKVEKSQSVLDYYVEQYEITKADYEEKQQAYAKYVDSNRGQMTASASVEMERLSSEMNLAHQVFSSVANNMMAAKVKVNEDNVLFTDIRPSVIPDKPSNSKKKTVILWGFIGGVLGCIWVLGKDKVLAFRKSSADEA